MQVLQQGRHSRKWWRGVHRGNRFRLVLGAGRDRADLEQRLQRCRPAGRAQLFRRAALWSRWRNPEQARRWRRVAAAG